MAAGGAGGEAGRGPGDRGWPAPSDDHPPSPGQKLGLIRHADRLPCSPVDLRPIQIPQHVAEPDVPRRRSTPGGGRAWRGPPAWGGPREEPARMQDGGSAGRGSNHRKLHATNTRRNLQPLKTSPQLTKGYPPSTPCPARSPAQTPAPCGPTHLGTQGGPGAAHRADGGHAHRHCVCVEDWTTLLWWERRENDCPAVQIDVLMRCIDLRGLQGPVFAGWWRKARAPPHRAVPLTIWRPC